ncbi:rhodanese-like domain-containing protein [Dechloromonas denitrificans]|uniref:rhodanese-like domain-containing protein n=1 Tax=Dechloromonas denitrificans TaxID=281362 RepID=UPI001CF84EC4|nr:rhodanese-like domain-containing protein [Dechloromonas denitrificans]UCV05629.1 rhodanese-like domain-containing protein [Dechloromonas denitrificans]UCV05946.1 rhodanese-like domain-containing protein [Dechloromonas denitrificans]
MSDVVIDVQQPSYANAVFAEKGFAAAASPILEKARQRAAEEQLPYAGSVSPQDAWALVSSGEAVLIDVRTAEERKFVGHVPETRHVAWMTGLSLSRNPRFTRELEGKAGKDDVVLLLCRSGKRSAAAAEAAAKAGFKNVFNILEGFEGDLDEQQRRGAFNGWRNAGLPWVQD